MVASSVAAEDGRWRVAPPRSTLLCLRYSPRHLPSSSLHLLSERSALHPLHAEIVAPLVLADFVDGHNVGMIEHRRSFGFGAKAPHFSGRGQLAGQDE